jgi:phosphatidylserine/phosphatidylglycerophosphate/cardiolipin synthase-like enzyme
MLSQWPDHVRSYCEKHGTHYQYCDDETEFLALKGTKRGLCVRGLVDVHAAASSIESPEKYAAANESLIKSMLESVNGVEFKPRVLHGKATVIDASNQDFLGGGIYLAEGTYILVLHMCE